MGHLLKLKYAHSIVPSEYLASTSVPLRLTTLQMQNLALFETKQITVIGYDKDVFLYVTIMCVHIFYTPNFPITCSYWKSKPDCKNISTGRQTDKKENQIFLIYKEIKTGAVAKSYMRKGSLIYEEMRKYFPIYEEAVSHI